MIQDQVLSVAQTAVGLGLEYRELILDQFLLVLFDMRAIQQSGQYRTTEAELIL